MPVILTEPSVECVPQQGPISFLAAIARTSTRAPWKSYENDVRILKNCWRKRHLSIFEFWPSPPPRLQWLLKPRKWKTFLHWLLFRRLAQWLDIEDVTPDQLESALLKIPVAPKTDLHVFKFLLSRDTADQLARHRWQCSWNMESGRSVRFDRHNLYITNDPEDPRSDAEIRMDAKCALQRYTDLLKRGAKPEIARRELGMGVMTSLVGCAPRKKWLDIIQKRAYHSTGQAQGEISRLMQRVEWLLGEREY